MGKCGLCCEFPAAAIPAWWELAWSCAGSYCFSHKHPLSPGSLHESCSLVLFLELQRSSPVTRIRLNPGCKCLISPRAVPAHSRQRQTGWDACPSSGNQRGLWLPHRFHVPWPLCAFLLCQGKEPSAWCWAGEPACREVKLASLRGPAPISDFLVACRGGSMCKRKGGGLVADVNCNVFLAPKSYFEILQITDASASRRVQPAVGRSSLGFVPCLVVH